MNIDVLIHSQLLAVLNKLDTAINKNKLENIQNYSEVAARYVDMYVKLMNTPVRNIDAKLRIENEYMKNAIEDCIKQLPDSVEIFKKHNIHKV